MARDEPSLGSAAATAPTDWRRKALAIFLALSIGAAGGFIFKLLSLPLPWMLGSMSFVTAATVMGIRPRIPAQFRAVMITVLGIMLGSSFTPEIFARMSEWIITISALAVWMVLAGTVALVYFRKVAGYDPVTAFFAATPGGLNEMVIVGKAMGGDDRTISLTHASRIMLVVFTIPLWYRFGATIPLAPRPDIGLLDVAWQDLALLALCAPVGALLARGLRIPAAFLVGPMILSALVHLSGLTASKPPDALVAFAQVAIGAAIGARFTGVTVGRMARTAAHAIISAVFMLAMTILFAVVLSRWTGYPVPALVLAFAPGGLAEMSLVALALSVDAAFVASHHIARIIMVVTLAPLVFRVARGRKV
jgi:uncharacterized protein